MDIFVWMKLFVQRVSLQFWHSLFDYSSGTLITFSTTSLKVLTPVVF